MKTSSASGRFSRSTLYWLTGMIVAVARIDLHQADAAALELQFADALDHDVGVAAAAAVAHVLDRDLDLPAHRLGVRAAHRIDQVGSPSSGTST